MRVTQTLKISDLNWVAADNLLQQKYKCPNSRKLIKQFMSNLRLFEPKWLGTVQIPTQLNLLATALCQVHGADQINILNISKFLNFEILKEILICAAPQNLNLEGSKGQVQSSLRLRCGSIELKINKVWQLAVFRLLLMVLGALLYTLVIGLCLYLVALYLLYLELPQFVTQFATRRPGLQLGAILVLGGLSGLIFRALLKFAHRLRGIETS